MSLTVKAAQQALKAARKHYTICEHRDVAEAKHLLDNARYAYLNACAALCTKLEFSTSVADVESELVNQGLWV